MGRLRIRPHVPPLQQTRPSPTARRSSSSTARTPSTAKARSSFCTGICRPGRAESHFEVTIMFRARLKHLFTVCSLMAPGPLAAADRLISNGDFLVKVTPTAADKRLPAPRAPTKSNWNWHPLGVEVPAAARAKRGVAVERAGGGPFWIVASPADPGPDRAAVHRAEAAGARGPINQRRVPASRTPWDDAPRILIPGRSRMAANRCAPSCGVMAWKFSQSSRISGSNLACNWMIIRSSATGRRRVARLDIGTRHLAIPNPAGRLGSRSIGISTRPVCAPLVKSSKALPVPHVPFGSRSSIPAMTRIT